MIGRVTEEIGCEASAKYASSPTVEAVTSTPSSLVPLFAPLGVTADKACTASIKKDIATTGASTPAGGDRAGDGLSGKPVVVVVVAVVVVVVVVVATFNGKGKDK